MLCNALMPLSARNSGSLFGSLFFKNVVDRPQHRQYMLAFRHKPFKPPFLEKLPDNAFVVLKEFIPNHPTLRVRHVPSAMNHQVTFIS